MKTPQEVFNLAIELKYYSNKNGKDLMCSSISRLYSDEHITDFEYFHAIRKINDYLGHFTYLAGALRNAKLPQDFKSRLKIYRNWESRPPLRWTQKCLFPLMRYLKKLSLPVFTLKTKQDR